MSDERQLMRDGLAAEARQISAGPEFAERVIGRALATAGGPGRQRPPGWHNWVLPAVAAVLVAVLVGSVLLGTKLLHSTGPASHPSPTVSQPVLTSPVPSNPTSPAPSNPTSPAPSGSASGQSSAGVPGPTGGPVPAGFRGYDLSWVSDQDGWALGTAPCGTPPCTSILRTTDGGRSWVGIPAPHAFLWNVDTCDHACDWVSNLRFATPLIGYAYGQNALYLTTDGGGSWHKQSVGSTYGLEVVAGSVLRVSGRALSGGDCTPPGCSFGIQRAAIGSNSWQDVVWPTGGRDAGAQLAASGDTVVLATYAHVTGGAQDATSVLFTSRDGGTNWQKVSEPCPQGSGIEVDSTNVTVAPDGSITVLCQPRNSSVPFTATSTDGVHFAAGAPVPGTQFGGVVGATSASQLFVLQRDRLYRSTDAGAHWAPVAGGPPGGDYIGFESATVGRVIGGGQPGQPDGTWTTTDGGASWTYHPFH